MLVGCENSQEGEGEGVLTMPQIMLDVFQYGIHVLAAPDVRHTVLTAPPTVLAKN